MQPSDLEDFLCSALAGTPDPQEDDKNNDLRGADEWLERGRQ